MGALRDFLNRWRWLDRLLVRIEAYTSLLGQHPWLVHLLYLVPAAMIGLFTYIQQSWLALAVLATVGTFVALKLVPRALRKETVSNRLSPDSHEHWSDDAAAEAPDRTAYYDLMGFTLNYLLSACDQQVALQEAIIRHISKNEEVAALAINGLRVSDRHDAAAFWENYNAIIEGVMSSEYTIKFSALINCIKNLEGNRYRMFCLLSDELAE